MVDKQVLYEEILPQVSPPNAAAEPFCASWCKQAEPILRLPDVCKVGMSL